MIQNARLFRLQRSARGAQRRWGVKEDVHRHHRKSPPTFICPDPPTVDPTLAGLAAAETRVPCGRAGRARPVPPGDALTGRGLESASPGLNLSQRL